MATVYYLNLNYQCNERCTFCAADLGGTVPLEIRRASASLIQIEEWLGDDRPGLGDRIMLSGGEPTLHRSFLQIVGAITGQCTDVVLFTNGLKLSDPEFARSTADAGVTRFEISLYGASGAAHDAVTRVEGSFARTMTALAILARLGVTVVVRLLVSRQTLDENVRIIRRVAAEVPALSFSINRLIFSRDAESAEATVSWAEARASVNECVRACQSVAREVDVGQVPVCVFDDDNLVHLFGRGGPRPAVVSRRAYRYFDPFVSAAAGSSDPRPRRALGDVCLGCAARDGCPGVTRSYVAHHGFDGLVAFPTSWRLGA